MKELLEVIVKNLVDNQDEVHVVEKVTEDTLTLELSVASDDMGKVIGKNGKVARAIRTVVKAGSKDTRKRVVVEILG